MSNKTRVSFPSFQKTEAGGRFSFNQQANAQTGTATR